MYSNKALSPVTLVLHWCVAVLVVTLLISGLIMIGKYYGFYFIHKTIGILAMLFIVPRVLWRIKMGWPSPLSRGHKWVHCTLLAGTIVMPLSGMLASGASGNGFGLFLLWEIVPRNPSPLNADEVLPYSEFWMNVGYALHSWVGYTMAVLIMLHVLAAIKHHWVDKDATLIRMLGQYKGRR